MEKEENNTKKSVLDIRVQKSIERLNLILEDLNLDNINQFSEKLGLDRPERLYKIARGENAISKNLAKLINGVFPQYSEDWLLTGEGSMLKEEKYFSNEAEGKEAGIEILVLPVSAEGGRLGDFSTQVKAEDCETMISPIKDIDFAMTVTGDSMFPEYPSGSKILVKKINEKAFIDWGRVYVLDTCNGAVIKKIMPSDDKNKITCESINPDYPSFEVSFEDIYGMYRVLMCMSLK